METKRCDDCGKIKPISAFYTNKHMVEGVLNQCKVCTKARQGHSKKGRATEHPGMCEARGLSPDQKKKYDLSLELIGRKFRKKYGVKAPANWWMVADSYKGQYGGVY